MFNIMAAVRLIGSFCIYRAAGGPAGGRPGAAGGGQGAARGGRGAAGERPRGGRGATGPGRLRGGVGDQYFSFLGRPEF